MTSMSTHGGIDRETRAYECQVVDRDDISPEVIATVTREITTRLLEALTRLGRAADWETFTLTIEERPAPAILPTPSPYVVMRGAVSLL